MRVKFKGTDWQQEVSDAINTSEDRFFSLIAGRRCGKTFVFSSACTTFCLQNPDVVVWYIAPTYSQAKEQYERIGSHPTLSLFISKIKQYPYPTITFTNGSKMAFRSFDNHKALRGSGIDIVWADEIQDINGKYFWPVIRPLISDKRGKLVISGQHRGQHSWYYKELFVYGFDGPGTTKKPLYKSWQIPSSRGMVFQGDAGKEELMIVKQQMPAAVYDQEYEALASANIASVYRSEDIKKIVTGYYSDMAVPGRKYLIGLDLGRVVDPSACVVIDDRGHVCYSELRPLGERHEVGAMMASAKVQRFGGCPIIIDTTGGAGGARVGAERNDEYVKYYKTQCPTMTSFFLSAESKKSIIENLAICIEQSKITIAPQCEELLVQLEKFEYKVRNSGLIEYSGPGGHDDDLVIALAMAVNSWRRGRLNGDSDAAFNRISQMTGV